MNKLKGLDIDAFELILWSCFIYMLFYAAYVGIDEFEMSVYNLVNGFIN